jgi:fibronectin-binding autotransporter adhesin
MNTRILLKTTLALLTAGGLQAADLTAPNANFNWVDTNAWNTGTATWSNSPADNAFFGTISSDRTSNLVSAITANNIDFTHNSNRWTISGSGGQITLNGAITKTNAGSVTLSTNTLLTGAGSISLGGGEFQLLNNANTFSGGITLNSGATLRVGNNSGTGTEIQTAGSLGTGKLTINGGTIFQNQGNVRTQAVAADINGNFSFNSVANGGLVLGSSDGSRLVSLGAGSRTITVSQNSDGTGASSFLGLRDVTSTVGSAIVKEGAGVLRLQGTSTAPITANAGTIEITGSGAGPNFNLGATAFTMNSGTVWRKNTSTAHALGSTMTLNNASLVNNDTLANQRSSTFSTFQVSGTSTVFVGQGLTIQSTGTFTSGITVRDGGVFGGNGTLRTAGTQAYSAGLTTFDSVTDSAITLSVGGKIRPGTVDSLNSTTGDLSFGALTWNGEASAIAQMQFNLGAANAADTLNLSGALTKGTGTNFLFDFQGFSAASASTFNLMNFASTTFLVGDFSATNITVDPGYTAGFVVGANSLDYVVTAIPEPGTLALLGISGIAAILGLRRRK